MLEKLKDTFRSGKRRPSEAFQQPEQIIALHRFGAAQQPGSPTTGEEKLLTSDYRTRVSNINGNNWVNYTSIFINLIFSCVYG